tara:strand:- start:262 stop:927 length:666 start_codon:yes stop_codon:yes gene_type:complete
MFHRIERNCKSKYDVKWEKFKTIIFTFDFIFKYILFKKLNDKILFTFDDGYSSQLIAARYLARYYKIFSLIFISTKFIEKPGFITSQQIQLNHSNYIKFGTHGHNHKSLNNSISDKEIYEELNLSKLYLEKISKRNILFLSYPNGQYNKKTLKISKDIGYKYIFTSKRASNRKKQKNCTFNRFVIMKQTPIILIFTAYTGIIDFAQSLKKLLRDQKFSSFL